MLRIVRRKARKQPLQVRPLAAGGDDLVGGRVEILQRIAAQILQFKLESAEASNAVDGGRLESRYNAPGTPKSLGDTRRHDVAGGVAWALSVIYGL